MLASIPASMLNPTRARLGIPRFRKPESRSSPTEVVRECAKWEVFTQEILYGTLGDKNAVREAIGRVESDITALENQVDEMRRDKRSRKKDRRQHEEAVKIVKRAYDRLSCWAKEQGIVSPGVVPQRSSIGQRLTLLSRLAGRRSQDKRNEPV